jgi:putative membrane protein
MYGWDTGTSVWMVISMVAIAVALALVVVAVARGAFDRPEPRDAAGEKPATAILDERFARGEIGREEYEERRQVLTRRG